MIKKFSFYLLYSLLAVVLIKFQICSQNGYLPLALEDQKLLISEEYVFNRLEKIVNNPVFPLIFKDLTTPALSPKNHFDFVKENTQPNVYNLLAAIFLIAKDLNYYLSVKKLNYFYKNLPGKNHEQNTIKILVELDKLLNLLNDTLSLIEWSIQSYVQNDLLKWIKQNSEYVNKARHLALSIKLNADHTDSTFIANCFDSFADNCSYSVGAAITLVKIGYHVEKEVMKNETNNIWKKYYCKDGSPNMCIIAHSLNEILHNFEILHSKTIRST